MCQVLGGTAATGTTTLRWFSRILFLHCDIPFAVMVPEENLENSFYSAVNHSWLGDCTAGPEDFQTARR